MRPKAQKFDYLNLSLRALVVISEALESGSVSNLNVRRLYSLHGRSKKAESFIANLVEGGYLRRTGRDRYEPTPKAFSAMDAYMRLVRVPKLLEAEENASPSMVHA
ncbi:MAG: hypothetical protein QXI37_00850 [Thermoprotei archaeon]